MAKILKTNILPYLKSKTYLKAKIDELLSTKSPTDHTHTSLANAGIISENDDLNNYKDAGYYICSKTNSASLENKPYADTRSSIIENKEYSAGNLVQFVYKVTTTSQNNEIFWRVFTANTWSKWQELYTNQHNLTAASAKPLVDGTANAGTSTNYAREDHVHPVDTSRAAASHTHTNLKTQSIHQGDDLNDYKTVGIYKNTISNQVKTMNNTPWQEVAPSEGGGAGTAFVMVVLDHAGIAQILRPFAVNNHDIYIRNYFSSDGWGSWKKVYTQGNLKKADITALGIPSQDTVYTHPASHASSMITEASAFTNIGSAANATQHAVNEKINSAIASLKSSADTLTEQYYRNSVRIKIGRWSDSQGEDGTKIEVVQSSGNGVYAKIYCDKPDFSLNNRDVILVLNGVPYVRTTDTTGKTEKLTINLGLGTYLLTAFMRGYDGLYPASDQKIIIVK